MLTHYSLNKTGEKERFPHAENASLGSITKFATKTPEKREFYLNNLKLKYKLQNVARSILVGDHRLKACCRVPLGKVFVNYDLRNKLSYYSGLMVCGKVWTCPICASKIASRRTKELLEIFRVGQQKKYVFYMVTYTIQHKKSDKLSVLLDDLTGAIRHSKSSGTYTRIKKKYGIIGDVSGLEVRFNLKTGWHPHKHHIVAMRSHPENINEFKKEIQKRYKDYLLARGYKLFEGTVDVTFARKEMYVSKWAFEISLSQSKKGVSFSPFQMLEMIRKKEPGYQYLEKKYFEYAASIKGKKSIYCNKKLREGVVIKDDAEIVLEDLKAEEVLEMYLGDYWKEIVRKKLRGEVIRQFTIFEGDIDKLENYLKRVGVVP